MGNVGNRSPYFLHGGEDFPGVQDGRGLLELLEVLSEPIPKRREAEPSCRMMGCKQQLVINVQPLRLSADQLKADCDAPPEGGVFCSLRIEMCDA